MKFETRKNRKIGENIKLADVASLSILYKPKTLNYQWKRGVNKMVDKLKWCFSKREVRLIEPNKGLAKEYLRSAEETLLVLKDITGEKTKN